MLLLAYEMPEALGGRSQQPLGVLADRVLPHRRTADDSRSSSTSTKFRSGSTCFAARTPRACGPRSRPNRPPLPYEDTNLLRALQHTVIPGVDACLAMETCWRWRNTFYRDYTSWWRRARRPAWARGPRPVEDAIATVPQDSKSITLSCGKLMTGVTVPAWAGILMLRELKSPESYFQAAFRVQSPWVSRLVNTAVGGEDEVIHKEHCYVLDFSPNRALRQIVDYATKLPTETAAEPTTRPRSTSSWSSCRCSPSTARRCRKLSAGDVIDYLTGGISSSMLARRWNSPELLTLTSRQWKRPLAEDILVEPGHIEMFRNITDDLTTMISTNKELRQKLAKEKLTRARREGRGRGQATGTWIKKKLQRFITRIPAFMYLTDDREKRRSRTSSLRSSPSSSRRSPDSRSSTSSNSSTRECSMTRR